MIQNNYLEVLSKPICIGFNEYSTYSQEIEKYLGSYKTPNGYKDFNWLIQMLNVIGPLFKTYNRLPEVIGFVNYIMDSFSGYKQNLTWIPPAHLTLLLYDLDYPIKKSWKAYQYLINKAVRYHGMCKSGYLVYTDFLACYLGIRMHGDLARDELKKIIIQGSYELINELASNRESVPNK